MTQTTSLPGHLITIRLYNQPLAQALLDAGIAVEPDTSGVRFACRADPKGTIEARYGWEKAEELSGYGLAEVLADLTPADKQEMLAEILSRDDVKAGCKGSLLKEIYYEYPGTEGFVTTCRYSTGSQSQENDAHMLEWLASRCIAKFFRTGFRGEEQHHMDCYYYQLHTPSFCWQSFDREETLYRRGYGSLLKAAALFFAECYPTLKSCVSLDDRQSARVNYCAPYFAHRPASEREKLEGLLKTLYTFLNFYANWMIQIVRTLPPILCQPAEAEGHLPENDLLDGEGMDELLLLLTQYGLRPEQRSRAEMSRAAEELQRELHHLVVRRVPDRRTAAKIIAGLGGGQRRGAGAEGAVCSFLATLLRCAGEEEDR